MTESALYLENMNLKEFTTEIESLSDEKYVTLHQTAFYPKSGGVDHDTGVLIRESDNMEFKVVYVGKFKGKISHEISPTGLKIGDKVKGILDWERRHELMRLHTAAHVISGVFFNEGNIKITGNDITIGKGRIDFNMENFDRNQIEQYVEKANEIIQQDLPIKTYYINRKEMEQDPSLVKLAMGISTKISQIRIVEIEEFDKQPDGGCHVSHLNEIGPVEIQNVKNKGKNNRRLYFYFKIPQN